MIKKESKLDRASRYYMGGGGGGGSSQLGPGGTRKPNEEKKTIGNWYDFQQNQYGDFVNNNPLLSAGQTGALDFWKQLPNMLSQFAGFQNEISGNQKDIAGYQGQLQNVYGGLGGLLGQIPGLQNQLGKYSNQLGALNNQVGGLTTSFGRFLGPHSALGEGYAETIAPMLRSGGAATQDQQNAAIQQARAGAAQLGGLQDPSQYIREYQGLKDVRDANFNQALAQSQGVLGQQTGAAGELQNIYNQQAGITGQRAGITGQQAGLLGLGGNLLGQQGSIAGQGAGLSALNAGLTGQKAGLLGQEQALQTGGLNQLLGVGNAAVSQFGGLTNPILGYLGNLFGGNQQAAIAQAQINAQQNAAGQAKGGSTIGGIISAVGPILGAVMSDERTKTKIKGTGLKTKHGVPLKIFEYKTKPGVPFIGVMAQDLKKKLPAEVFTDPVSGVEMVSLPFSPVRVRVQKKA